MEVSRSHGFSAYKGQPTKNQVCKFWLRGECRRNPCMYMHRESPPPPQFKKQLQFTPTEDIIRKQSRYINRESSSSPPLSKQSQFAPPEVISRKQPRNTTWKNPNLPKTVAESTNGGGRLARFKTNNIQSTPQKVVSEVTREKSIEQESVSVQKAQPSQCKYWLTGNCVQGEKCKDLHSWFSGSGFTMLGKLEGHNKGITGISLPSGVDRLYSGGKDMVIRAWDCNSGQCVGSLNIDGEVGCLVSEGPWVFVGLPNTIKAWNLQNQAEISLGGPVGQVHCIVVDNDMIYGGIEDGTILLWKLHPETNIPELAAILKEHNGPVTSLVIGGARLYSASRDCTIKVWDLQSLRCIHTLHGHTREVTSVLCWDSYLLSASLDNTLKVWCATESGTLEVVYEVKEDYGLSALCGIYDAEKKPILLCSFKDNTVRLYDLPSFAERGRIFSKQEVQVIEVGVDGLFFTGDAAGEISVWRLLGAPSSD